MGQAKTARTCLLQLAKVGLSAALIGYLVWDSLRRGEGVFADEHGFNPEKFWALLEHARQLWYFLGLGFAAGLAGVLLTFLRWWILVRVVAVPLKLTESLRLSFVGFLLNLAPMGMVGGDLAKAILAARRCPEHRAETVASVFVDRILGLYALFLVASAAILFTGSLFEGPLFLRSVCQVVLAVTAGATVILVLSWAPDMTGGRLGGWLETLPFVGRMLARFVEAFRAYRHHPSVLVFSIFMTLPVHLFFAVSIYFIGLGLFERVHPLGQHFVFCPLAAVMQIIPVSIGPAEFVLDRLFTLVPLGDGSRVPPGQGLVALLVYRFFSLFLGAGGLAFFLAGRSEWKEALNEAERSDGGSPKALAVPPHPL